jgi:peptidoglycan/LPS O-acetylase OafA/YrhL
MLKYYICNLYSMKISRDNNFDKLRFFAASLVILSHSYLLSGGTSTDLFYQFTRRTIAYPGMAIFFIISGYLITQSWMNTGNSFKFLKKRILRIYPALICAILVTTLFLNFVIFKNIVFDDWIKVLINIPLMQQYSIPSWFSTNFYYNNNCINGSIWSLQLEFQMYIFTMILGLFGLLKKKWSWITILAISILSMKFKVFEDGVVTDYRVYYIIVSLYYVYKDKIKFNTIIGICAVAVWFLFTKTEYLTPASWITLPYAVLWIGNASTNVLYSFFKSGDYTYGLYIYAFPIQQSTVFIFQNRLNPYELFIIAYPLSLAFAILSWHYIEQKFLSLKEVPLQKIFSNDTTDIPQMLSRK